jgi:hypothetical protein
MKQIKDREHNRAHIETQNGLYVCEMSIEFCVRQRKHLLQVKISGFPRLDNDTFSTKDAIWHIVVADIKGIENKKEG